MRSAIAVSIAILTLAAGVIYASPYLALNGLRDALEARDAEAISDRVDFPRLRENIKDQLGTVMSKELGTPSEDDAIGVLAAGVASMMIDTTLDALVTPSGIARLVAGDPAAAGSPSGNPRRPHARRNLLSEARVVHETFDRVSVWVPNDYGDEFRLVMRRYGLRWKLTNVIIPGIRSASP